MQKRPVKPEGQRHEKRLMPSRQVAPLPHGFIRQSSTLVSQRGPVNPARQRHVNSAAKPSASSHRPPFLHGDLRGDNREQRQLKMMGVLWPDGGATLHPEECLSDRNI